MALFLAALLSLGALAFPGPAVRRTDPAFRRRRRPDRGGAEPRPAGGNVQPRHRRDGHPAGPVDLRPDALRPPRPPRGKPAGRPDVRVRRPNPLLSTSTPRWTSSFRPARRRPRRSQTSGRRTTSRYPRPVTAQPELTLSLSQPLLKGLGKQVTERGITTADDAMELSLADWNQKALDTAAEARNRFLTLAKARESLATRKASLAVARRVHEEKTARVNAGVLAAFELQDSELGVLQREKGSPRRGTGGKGRGRSASAHPAPGPRNGPRASRHPLDGRPGSRRRSRPSGRPATPPDLSKARTSLRTAEFNEKVSRNLALPALSLEGSSGSHGNRRRSTGTRSTTWAAPSTPAGRWG